MSPDRPTAFQALGETVARASRLIQLEVQLAKAEIAEKSVHLKAGLAAMMSGAILLTVALLLATQALVLLLIRLGMSPLGATALVTVIVGTIGFILMMSGRKQFDAATLTPNRTLDDLERDRDLVKEKLT